MKTITILILTFFAVACEVKEPKPPFNPPMTARRFMTDLGYEVVGVACSPNHECAVRVKDVPSPVLLLCLESFEGRGCRFKERERERLEVQYAPSMSFDGPMGTRFRVPL